MAGSYIPSNLSGGFSYTPTTFSFGADGVNVNGGYSFDMPLATVAAFTNSALDFTANNSNAARGFFSNVVSTSQGNVTAIADKSFALQQQGLNVVDQMQQRQMDVQRYAIKKAYQTGCFITTAVTKAKGLPDDCHELQSLRTFRDGYLSETEEGQKLIDLYYRVAPAIVAGIDARPDATALYARLDSLFIQPALQRIGSGENEVALGIYTAMVLEAAVWAGVDITADTRVDNQTCTCKAGKRAANFHAKTCPVRG